MYYWNCLKSGGAVVGALISLWGVGQWVYETVSAEPKPIHIEWYILVIIGLVIVLFSSLRKARLAHKKEMILLKQSSESERRELQEMYREISTTSLVDSNEPISLDVTVSVDRPRTLADIYSEAPENRGNVLNLVTGISGGIIHITNNSKEPVNIEIEKEVLDGNVPILLQNRKDNVPIPRHGHMNRSIIVNPKNSIDVVFAVYALVDRLHKGFKLPSFLSSSENKMGYQIEGRISTFMLGKLTLGKKTDFYLPHIDLRLKVIASSARNVSNIIDIVGEYRITANPISSKLTVKRLEI